MNCDPGALAHIREAGAEWLLDSSRLDGLLAAAASASTADGVPTEVVALASLYPDAAWGEVEDALRVALVACNSEPLEPQSELVNVLALRHRCRLFQEGAVTARELVRQAHGLVGHGGHAAAQALVELDDDYDLHDELGEAEIADGEVASLVERFMSDTSQL